MALMSYAASSQAARFMLSHPAHWVAMGFGSGLSPWAPGTVGTLWAWASFLLMSYWLDTTQLAWVLTAALPLGWWASTVTARHLGVSDPGNIVWDEIVAFWLVLWLLLYAFVLWCYLATLRHLAHKPSASLLANPQNYPGLLPAHEV